MTPKLFDSELKVMEILWENGDLTAGQIAFILNRRIGWNRNTTYTVIKKCMAKGAIERLEPNFLCRCLVSKQDVQKKETHELIGKFFQGSPDLFFASFLNEKELDSNQIDSLKKMIDDLS